MLEALYEVLELVQPAWTDEMGVALDAVDPSRWHNSFRLYEGFVTAEASALFPHLAKSRFGTFFLFKHLPRLVGKIEDSLSLCMNSKVLTVKYFQSELSGSPLSRFGL
jgi:hypothetical protein